MSAYVDQAFQKITEKPCQDCKFYSPHDETPQLAKCQYYPIAGLWEHPPPYAAVMRENPKLCGLEGKLWQAV